MNRRPPLFTPKRDQPGADQHLPLLASIEAGRIDFHAVGRGHYPGHRLEPGQLPRLLSAGYWDARGDQNWGMDFHRNEGVEICLLETGSMRFAVDDAQHPMGPGQLTITRPWQVHRQGDPLISASRLHWATIDVRAERPDQPWRWPAWVVLSPADQEELTRRLRRTEYPVWRASPDVINGFQRSAAALAKGGAEQRLSRVALGLNEMLLGVLDLLRSENCVERPRLASREHTVELFLSDLRKNLNGIAEDWTLDSMAAACGTGTTLFSRLCRRLTNDSPIRFLNLARLDAASRLLRAHPDRSVTDIAFDCGFQSSQYFAHQFQRRFGQTPTEYRRKAARRCQGGGGLAAGIRGGQDAEV